MNQLSQDNATSPKLESLQKYYKNCADHKQHIKQVEDFFNNLKVTEYAQSIEGEQKIRDYLDTLASAYDEAFLINLKQTIKDSTDDTWFDEESVRKYVDDLLGVRREISIAMDIDCNMSKEEALKLFTGMDEETYKKLEHYFPVPICHTDFLPYLKSL